jgi:hypothetical protein
MTTLKNIGGWGGDTPAVLYEDNPRTAAKHAAACANARKAYLRSIYGFQPHEGEEYGVVLSVQVYGSIATIEIRFFMGTTKTHKGTFELPLHVFKVDGEPVTSSAAIKRFVDHVVLVTVIDRYDFDGIPLSNVTDVDLDSNIVHTKRARASHSAAKE